MFCSKCGRNLGENESICPVCNPEMVTNEEVVKKISYEGPEISYEGPEISYEGPEEEIEKENTATPEPTPAAVPLIENTVIVNDNSQVMSTEFLGAEEQIIPSQNTEGNSKKKNIIPFVIIILSLLAIIVSIVLIILSKTEKKKYTGDVWYDDIETEEQDIPEITSFGNAESDESSMASEWVYGYHSVTGDSKVAMDDQYYYLANPGDEGCLYKVSKSEPHTAEKLSDLRASSINLVNDVLYINVTGDEGGVDSGIYSLNTDGSDQQFIINGKLSNVKVVNDWIYYIRGMDGKLCKLTTFNRHEIVIDNNNIKKFFIEGNEIFCQSVNEAEEYYSVYVLDVDGNMLRSIMASTEEYCFMSYGEGMIILGSYDDHISVFDKDSGMEISTIAASVKDTPYIYNGTIYYIDGSDELKIAAAQYESGYTVHYQLPDVKLFDICDDNLWIYYNSNTTEPMFTVINVANGQNAKIFE